MPGAGQEQGPQAAAEKVAGLVEVQFAVQVVGSAHWFSALFKPSPVSDTITIKCRGVEPATRYRVSFEDGSNPAVEKTGAELANGLDVTLRGAPMSELIFLEPPAP